MVSGRAAMAGVAWEGGPGRAWGGVGDVKVGC